MEETSKTPSATLPARWSDMATIPGGWAVQRFGGPRWENENLRFRLADIPTFAIDIYEYPNRKGEMPQSASWRDASAACGKLGKRLCAWPEWQKACGQAQGLPYPFGPDFNCTRCSFAPCGGSSNSGKIMPSGSFPECKGRYPVYDLAGNMSEYVQDRWDDSSGHYMVAGGSFNLNLVNDQRSNPDGTWTFKTYSSECGAVHHHEPTIVHHDDGFRCCADAP